VHHPQEGLLVHDVQLEYDEQAKYRHVNKTNKVSIVRHININKN
jgi:hypothetical protein